MANTDKYLNFIRSPIGDKSINTIPGISKLTEKKFMEQGFSKAYHLLGQFLILNKDIELFDQWLNTVNMKDSSKKMCIETLAEWCHHNI
jgi:hypothetical protein